MLLLTSQSEPFLYHLSTHLNILQIQSSSPKDNTHLIGKLLTMDERLLFNDQDMLLHHPVPLTDLLHTFSTCSLVVSICPAQPVEP